MCLLPREPLYQIRRKTPDYRHGECGVNNRGEEKRANAIFSLDPASRFCTMSNLDILRTHRYSKFNFEKRVILPRHELTGI